MTIPNTSRKAGPLSGNGSTTAFPFTFKVFSAADIQVTIANSFGAETVLVLNTDYSVSLNGNQETSPGGTVTYPISGSPLPSGSKLSIVGAVPYEQSLDLPSGGNFSPTALENQLDKLCMQIQQVAEEADRAAKIPVTSSVTTTQLIEDILAIADNSANVNAVAASISDVNTVASISGDVQNVAFNVTDVQNFAKVYLGSKTSDPGLRNDSTALLDGDLYFNTVQDKMRVYSGATWIDAAAAVPISITSQLFSGTGAQTAFTLSASPAYPATVEVFISGVRQIPTTNYTSSGTTLTFVVAPPSGTNNVFVRWLSPTAAGVPDDGSVTLAKLSPALVLPVTQGGTNATDAATARTNLGTNNIPVTATAGTTAGATIRGGCYSATGGITIPASVFAAGETFSIYNNTAANLTITQGASLTLRQVGTANTGNRTLAQRGLATVLFISATEAVISGGGLT